MKRRLTRAYDNMTMPDSCARRIEARLQEELQARENGQYTKVVSPLPPRRRGWAAAAVVVCMVLVLSVGGTALFLRMTGAGILELPEVIATAQKEPLGDYTVATDIPASMVEEFAAEVRKNLLEEDWEAFSEKIQYPISILARGLSNDTAVRKIDVEKDSGMVGLFLRNTVNTSFLEEIHREKCTDMFCNWQGITMADGRIWINEINGQLKITAIYGIFADTPDSLGFVLKEMPDGNYTVLEYAGQEENIEIPGGRYQKMVTQVGIGEPVITYGDKVKTVKVPDTVQTVREAAFANCPALEAVYFAGDAPAEAEGVFEGSENVIVYYQNGTQGWGDTWCGRKTLEYGEGHISLGTVAISDEYDRAVILYENILDGNGYFYAEEFAQMLTISQFCERKTERAGQEVSVTGFTLADLDADGMRELILRLSAYEALILREEDGSVRGLFFQYGQVDALTKDGSFLYSGNGVETRVEFGEKGELSIISENSSQQDKPLAQWHVYPCQGATLVLESYRYASESGISSSPGYGYYYFRSLAYGEMENNWNSIQHWMSREGVCIENKDTVCAFDPDAPGCVFYGTLTGEGEQRKFSSIGYYICNDTEEKRAEVHGLAQLNPVYTVDVPPDDRGRMVETPDEMMAYIGNAPYYDTVSRDVQQIAELLDRFVHHYAANAREEMKACMAETAGNISSYPFGGDVSILTYGVLPDTAVNVGEKWHTTVELLESGETGTNYHLDVALVKQTDGWKVQSYSLEKQ
ncbi:MAG: hypothetical protein IJN20_07900 [Oscillospiraceae bacterium]|nr:hypothetical protein [Oscillospiraceae bacterium]